MLSLHRDEVLLALGMLGAARCLYYNPADVADPERYEAVVAGWRTTRCDCKFGVAADGRTLAALLGGKLAPGERSGCAELRQAYELLAACSEHDWLTLQELRHRRTIAASDWSLALLHADFNGVQLTAQLGGIGGPYSYSCGSTFVPGPEPHAGA